MEKFTIRWCGRRIHDREIYKCFKNRYKFNPNTFNNLIPFEHFFRESVFLLLSKCEI